MALFARPSTEPRQPAPEGKYFGICVGVFDIGVQECATFGPKHQVVLMFELHRLRGVARDVAGQPLLISVLSNLSFNSQSHLRTNVEQILGRRFTETEAQDGFDVTSLILKQCRLVVVHKIQPNGSARDRVEQFMPLELGDPACEPVSEPLVYELDPGRPLPASLPLWIQRKVMESRQWRASHGSPFPFRA